MCAGACLSSSLQEVCWTLEKTIWGGGRGLERKTSLVKIERFEEKQPVVEYSGETNSYEYVASP